MGDGIPTVMIESWIARTPVVASLVGGMAEVVVDGETGLVFPSDDYNALAKCVLRLTESDTLRSTLAEKGFRAAQEKFSPELNVGKLIQAIESLHHH